MATTAGSFASARFWILRFGFGSDRSRSTSAIRRLHLLGLRHAFGERAILEIRERRVGRRHVERTIAVVRHRTAPFRAVDRNALAGKADRQFGDVAEAGHGA